MDELRDWAAVVLGLVWALREALGHAYKLRSKRLDHEQPKEVRANNTQAIKLQEKIIERQEARIAFLEASLTKRDEAQEKRNELHTKALELVSALQMENTMLKLRLEQYEDPDPDS